MSDELWRQILLLCGEGVVIVAALLLMFHLRALFGLVPVYIAVATIYQLANLTASSVYIQIRPDLVLSPGSVVIFPAVLVVVLLLYIREDAEEARKLIYGLLAGDLVAALLGLLIAQHFHSSLFVNPQAVPMGVFLQQPRILIVGTLALFADTVLIILVYESLSRTVFRSMFVQISASLVIVLLFDTVLFVTGTFVETPSYVPILVSDAIGKAAAGVFYAVPVTLYVRHFEPAARSAATIRLSLVDLFERLTYRQRYEALRVELTRDWLTGVYNRAFFDDTSELLAAGSRRSGRPFAILMIDVDDFKQINDTFGHRTGDRVLQSVAASIRANCRPSDLVCRYGGEEFTVLLPDANLADGISIAGRLGPAVTSALANDDERWVARPVTVTVGIACFPADASTVEEVLQIADRRMYEGKQLGRNRIVPERPVTAPTAQREIDQIHGDATQPKPHH